MELEEIFIRIAKNYSSTRLPINENIMKLDSLYSFNWEGGTDK